MINQIKAKVCVSQVKENHFTKATPEAVPEKYSEEVYMNPVYGNGEENKSYSEATPSGAINLTITNPAAWGFFVEGKEYYVDFTPAQV